MDQIQPRALHIQGADVWLFLYQSPAYQLQEAQELRVHLRVGLKVLQQLDHQLHERFVVPVAVHQTVFDVLVVLTKSLDELLDEGGRVLEGVAHRVDEENLILLQRRKVVLEIVLLVSLDHAEGEPVQRLDQLI